MANAGVSTTIEPPSGVREWSLHPKIESRILAFVHRRLSFALGLLLAIIAAGDPLFCPDGCGRVDISLSHSSTTSPSCADCVFCRTGGGQPEPRIVPQPAVAM